VSKSGLTVSLKLSVIPSRDFDFTAEAVNNDQNLSYNIRSPDKDYDKNMVGCKKR
jgi:hypothetical protein